VREWGAGKDFFRFVETMDMVLRSVAGSEAGAAEVGAADSVARTCSFPAVGERVTLRDVRRAYRRGLRACHPDKQGPGASSWRRERAAAVFRLLQARHEVLASTLLESGRNEYVRSLSPWLG
jgi:hypothetical protein